MENEYTLSSPPKDGISSLAFSPYNNHLLLVSSWNTEARMYNSTKNELLSTHTHDSPVLSSCWINDSTISTCTLNGQVKSIDFEKNVETNIGYHEDGIKCLLYQKKNNLLFTGSWDSTVKVWDVKNGGDKPVSTFTLPGKVYAMAMTPDESQLVVGTHGRHVYVYDIKDMNHLKLTQKRESSLKYQTRCIECFMDGSGYALGSIEGRVAMEYFDPSESVQAKKYAFKCHRVKEGSLETLYPVNAIAFHPKFGTFATGGSDKVVNTWDGFAKKRLWSKPYTSSISSLSFRRDGAQLAIASSYCFEKGPIDNQIDEIFIRNVSDTMVKGK